MIRGQGAVLPPRRAAGVGRRKVLGGETSEFGVFVEQRTVPGPFVDKRGAPRSVCAGLKHAKDVFLITRHSSSSCVSESQLPQPKVCF